MGTDCHSDIIDRIYDAAVDADQWVDVTKRIGDATGGFGGALTLWDVEHHRPPTTFNQAFPEPFWSEYLNHLIQDDPLVPAFLSRPDLEIYTGEMLIGADTDRHHEVRKFIRSRCDQRHAYGARLFATAGIEATLILSRSSRQGAAQQNDLERLALFVPHLRRSILMARKIGERATIAALEALSFGIVVVDAAGSVIFANRAMEEISAHDDGIRISQGGLALRDSISNTAYLGLIGQLRRRTYLEGSVAPTAIPAHRPSGKHPYSILVCPLSGIYASAFAFERTTLICVSDPTQAEHINSNLLSALFDLTPAEARLASALVRLGSLSAAAAECGLAGGSARQYLKRIFSKTNTSSQVAFVTLVTRSLRL